MWKLISYSQVRNPLKPSVATYTLGIIENRMGERKIARIDVQKHKKLRIGSMGTIRRTIGLNGTLTIFSPNSAKRRKETSPSRKIIAGIERVGIIGTGVMGKQLTRLVALHGINVVLKSRFKKSLQKARGDIKNNLLEALSSRETNMVLRKIVFTTRWYHLSDVDLVIDCTIENVGVKKKVLKKLERICSKRAILSSNTSALSIAEIAAGVSTQSRVVGIHFFNPAGKMQLVEIVKGEKTSKETTERVLQFASCLEKVGLVVNDSPGFIVNRLLFTMINEAAYMVQEKQATRKEIDVAMKLGANHPMGPFEIADVVEKQTTKTIIQELYRRLPGMKAPARLFEGRKKENRKVLKQP